MANFKLIPSVHFEVRMTITEEQARALEHVSGFSVEDIVKKIVSHTGGEKESKHLISFLEDCRDNIGPQLKRIDASRNALNE